MKILLPFWCLGLVPVLSVNLLGQAFPQEPLELRQAAATVNVSSLHKAAALAGSDSPAHRQNGSVMTFGGGVGIGGSPTKPPTLNTNQSLLDNAVSLNLPRLGGANPTHVLLRARIGSPVSAVAPGTPSKVVADLTVPRGDVSSTK